MYLPSSVASVERAQRSAAARAAIFMPEADPGSLVYTAAYHGNVRHLKKLLQRHAKELDSLLKWPHPHGGATAIYVACEFGHTDAVKLLLEAKAPPDQPREDGATPLYKACQDGKLDIVKLLLKHGAKVDQIDANQMTALWVACHQGHIELAKVLLEAKADPTFKVQEWTPIMLAEREQRNELVELLLKHAPAGYEEQRQPHGPAHGHAHGGGGGAATTTAEQQQAAALQAMGMQQQNPEVTRTHRFYRAATANDEKSVRRMLESEEVGDITAAPGEGGATALYAVCIQGNCSMAQLLLDARASPNIALKNGETALLAATTASRLDVARLLLEHSADVNACTAHGKTALMVACHKGDGAMARLLLDEGASTGEVLKGKGTALISAASVGQVDCVRMLLDEGNDESLSVRFQNRSALEWALHGSSENHRMCVALLKSAVAEIEGAKCPPPPLDGQGSADKTQLAKGAAPAASAGTPTKAEPPVPPVSCTKSGVDRGELDLADNDEDELAATAKKASAQGRAEEAGGSGGGGGESAASSAAAAAVAAAVVATTGDVEDKSSKKKEKDNGTPSEGPMGVTAAAPSASESAASSKAAADPGVDTPMPTPPTAPTRKGAGAASAPNVPTVAPADAPASAPVNLGPGRTGRIELHEGDDPRKLAANLAKAHGLDASVEAKFGGLIEAGSHSHGDSVGLRARKPAAAAVEEEDNPFRVKRPDAPAWQLKWWRKEHTQFLYVVLAAIFFAVAIVGFVYYDDWRRNQEEIVKAAYEAAATAAATAEKAAAAGAAAAKVEAAAAAAAAAAEAAAAAAESATLPSELGGWSSD